MRNFLIARAAEHGVSLTTMEYEPNLSKAERRLFEAASPALHSFADTHGIKLSKWFKDVAIWAFEFRHPRGGISRIDFESVGGGRAKIVSYWTISDYDAGSERARFVSIPASENIADQLEKVLTDILYWTPADLSAPVINKNIHKYWTKARWEECEQRFPFPKT